MQAPEQTIQTVEKTALNVMDATAALVTVGTVSNWFFGVGLPGMAALFTVVWTGLRIWNEIATIRDRNAQRKKAANGD
jgi:hypothetical protein